MTKISLVRGKKTWGDTAVDGLLAGLAGGLVMSLILVAADWLIGRSPLLSLGYFDPAGTGNWLTGLLAHLAVSALYGAGLALLLRGIWRMRPAWIRPTWLWGAVYGLLLWGVAAGAVLTPALSIVEVSVDTALTQIPGWEFALAHLLYGSTAGYRLQKID
jgi:hypothetical protein